jgi:hypothetical protein
MYNINVIKKKKISEIDAAAATPEREDTLVAA